MAFKINNPFKSPLHNDDPALKIIENNKRIIQERRNQYQGLKDERQHVADARDNVKNVLSNESLQEQNLKYQDTLAGKQLQEYLKNNNVQSSKGDDDILGGKLVKKSTFDWLENIEGNPIYEGDEIGSSRMGCNSYACAIGGAAGMRVPQNEKGGINIYEESANGGKGGNVWYASGDPMPIVPWNRRFDKRAEDLGFELQPKGTLPDQGDFIRAGYDMHQGDYVYDEQTGEYNTVNLPYGSTGHAAIATESLAEGGKAAYNPGDIYKGVKQNKFYLQNIGFKGGKGTEATDRVQRYVGSVPYLENKFTEYSEDPNNKLQTWDTSSLEQPIAIPDPKESIPDIKMPIRYTPDQIKKMKKESRKRNK